MVNISVNQKLLDDLLEEKTTEENIIFLEKLIKVSSNKKTTNYLKKSLAKVIEQEKEEMIQQKINEEMKCDKCGGSGWFERSLHEYSCNKCDDKGNDLSKNRTGIEKIIRAVYSN